MEQNTITRDALKHRLDHNESFHLVMVLGEMAYRAKHIPKSENLATRDEFVAHLPLDADIVIYCSSQACAASHVAYRLMIDEGYTQVKRYVGGLLDWEEAGLPIEGELA